MKLRIAFAGFRHGHIMSVYNWAKGHAEVEIVAASEPDEATREELRRGGKVTVTHESHLSMLDGVECDIVAVGDYYAARGGIIIAALERCRHVIADKPICTRLDEIKEIERLAKRKKLSVFAQLDLRVAGQFLALRQAVRGGEVGEVEAIGIGGQHPLSYGSRPNWYFEKAKHGGTINDIAIHGVDAIPWLTGHEFARVLAAREWPGALLPAVPFFKGCAQFMATLANGAGVLCDVSYLVPDGPGYGIPQYWRTTVWGTLGVAETSAGSKEVRLYKKGVAEVRVLPAVEPPPGGYLAAFLREIAGERDGLLLTTPEVLRASRVCLLIQDAASRERRDVAVPSPRKV